MKWKNKFLAVLVALALCVTCAVPVFAADTPLMPNIEGDVMIPEDTETVEKNTITKGLLRFLVRTVEVPESVTKIEDGAFIGYPNLEDVYIDAHKEDVEIEDGAFPDDTDFRITEIGEDEERDEDIVYVFFLKDMPAVEEDEETSSTTKKSDKDKDKDGDEEDGDEDGDSDTSSTTVSAEELYEQALEEAKKYGYYPSSSSSYDYDDFDEEDWEDEFDEDFEEDEDFDFEDEFLEDEDIEEIEDDEEEDDSSERKGLTTASSNNHIRDGIAFGTGVIVASGLVLGYLKFKENTGKDPLNFGKLKEKFQKRNPYDDTPLSEPKKKKWKGFKRNKKN